VSERTRTQAREPLSKQLPDEVKARTREHEGFFLSSRGKEELRTRRLHEEGRKNIDRWEWEKAGRLLVLLVLARTV
jgi:hypothetical protein